MGLVSQMDNDIYTQSIKYEQLVQSIYQEILAKEGVENVQVDHDVKVRGRSGVEHQIDVLWRFKQAGMEHTVLIECKNYAKALNLEKVRNFFAVIFDIGNCQGVMATKTGYQSGAAKFAEFYGIAQKLVREPNEDDWEGKVQDIVVKIIPKQVVSNERNPLIATFAISGKDEIQNERIKMIQEFGTFFIPDPPTIKLYNAKREPTGETLGWWLPQQLNVLDQEIGGPYKETILPKNKWIVVNEDREDEEFVKVDKILVEYYVEEFDAYEVTVQGKEIVEAILKDFESGETEHVKRRKP